MSYAPPPPPPGQGGYAVPQANQKALWSLILGILSLICCGLFTGIPALLLAGAAKKEIAASGGAQTGEGMATAGTVLGWIGIVLSVLVVIALLGLGAFSTEFSFSTSETGY